MKQRYLFTKLVLAGAFLGFALQMNAQNIQEKEKIRSSYDLQKLETLRTTFAEQNRVEKAEALRLAQLNGWQEKVTLSDGRIMELQRVVDGKPIYYVTYNSDAARSTRTDHLNSGGSLGLNLNGQGMTAHVWDGGGTRTTHQEFDGAGGNNRVTIIDGSTLNGNSFHAMHVTGTIMASGVQANAKGMAPHAQARTADWNSDLSEATSEASNAMLVSNHSYGFGFRDQFGQVQLPQSYFGGYIAESRDWDNLLFNAPSYLMVVAAGNDGNDNTANQNPTGGSGWDKLVGHSTSKNNLVVANAQDANVNSAGDLISVAISSSSSEGPTDDFRIKPDIAGNGSGVYSTFDNSDSAYNTISGTSMASPNVAGSLLLLQQHYKNLNSGSFMLASTLKGLALHTADDAGASGPDAVFGWGLMNTKRAAETITDEGSASKIEELSLTSGQSYSITVDSDGSSPLFASISWTDRPGTAVTTVNSTTPTLVNDLDIRVTKGGTTYFPYKLLTPTSSGQQDNNVDPYERVDISGASGSYTITVTHKGTLVGGSQNFSLIVTGISDSSNPPPPPPPFCSTTITSFPYGQGFESGSGWTQITGDDGDWVRTSGSTPSGTTGPSSADEGSFYMFLEASTNGSPGQIGGNATAILESDCFDLSGKSAATFSFSNHMYGTNIGSLTIQASTDGTNWTNVWTDSGNQGNQWNSSSVNLSAYLGGNVKLRIVGTTGNGWRSDIAVDNLSMTVVDAGADTQAPSTPTGLSASNVTQTTLTVSWNASTDNVGVTGYDVYQGASNLGTVTGTSANITGLTANTSYTFSVRAKDAAGNVSNASSGLNVTTLGNAPTYCASSGSRTTYEWIDYVALGGMTNSTGASSGYADYTNLTATVARGSSNTVTISAGFSGSAYTEFWNVWIDFNQDGTFDSSELVTSGSSSSSANLTGTFTVPSNAVLGNTRMRVSMKYNAAATPCENFGDGEVEDYTVNVTASGTSYTVLNDDVSGEALGNESAMAIKAYPNPATNLVNVYFGRGENLSFVIADVTGKVINQGQLRNHSIDISQLERGIYILRVNDGQKSLSTKLIKQ